MLFGGVGTAPPTVAVITGRSELTAILGTHVPVVFFNIPVASPAREVPLILVTVVEFVLLPVPSKLEPVEVTSPVRVPIVRGVARAVAVHAFPDTLVWSPVLVQDAVPHPITSVPVVAGAVNTTPVPATALGWIVTSPEVFP